jgi:hypothetical protein
LFFKRELNSFPNSNGISFLEAAYDGGVGGLFRANNINGIVPIVAKEFWTNKKKQNLLRFSGVSLSSLSPIIPAAIINPMIHPIGIASPPRAVDNARSLSPNHALANLLDELIKNP